MLIILDLIGFVFVVLLSLFGLRNLMVSAFAWLDPVPMPATEISAYGFLVVIGFLYLIVAIWHALQIISYHTRLRLVLNWLGILILVGQATAGFAVLLLSHDLFDLSSTFKLFVQATSWLAYVNLLLFFLWAARRWIVQKSIVPI